MTRLLICRKHKRRDEVTEQHISLLLNCGLLTRHLTQKDTYWFALAGIGPLIKSLVKGRKVCLYCMQAGWLLTDLECGMFYQTSLM